jgi:hypothetical protein
MEEDGNIHGLGAALTTHNTGGRKGCRAGLDIVVNKTTAQQACRMILYGMNVNCDFILTQNIIENLTRYIQCEYCQKKITPSHSFSGDYIH